MKYVKDKDEFASDSLNLLKKCSSYLHLVIRLYQLYLSCNLHLVINFADCS